MKSKYIFDIRENKLSLLFDLLWTVDFAQFLQVVLDYELQVFYISFLHFKEFGKRIT